MASLGALPGPLYWSQTVQQYSTCVLTSVWCGQSGITPRSIILVPDSTAVFILWSDKCLVWLVWEHSQVHYIGSQTSYSQWTWECSQTSHTKHLSDQRMNTAVLSGTNIMDLGVIPDWPHQTLVRPQVEYCCTVWDQYNGPGSAPRLATPNTCQTKG